METVETRIKRLIEEASTNLAARSTGELTMEIVSRMPVGTQLRITARGVRATHSQYLDKLTDASAVDNALAIYP